MRFNAIESAQLAQSIYSPAYQGLIERLVHARNESCLTQQEVADGLGKPQSYIAKIEGLERRLDVIELFQIAKVLGVDPLPMLKKAWNDIRGE